MKNSSKYTKLFWACLLLLPFSCSRKDDDFREFLEDKELIYPGKVENIEVCPGNGRLQLKWAPSPDPHVVRYVIKWNNGRDSVVINSTSHNSADTIRYTIDNLAEYNYSFMVYSYDDEGNRSVVSDVNNAQSYGPIYKSGLFNRPPNDENPFTMNGNGSVTLHFNAPDTINIITKIAYTNGAGQNATAEIQPGENSITLPSLTIGEPVTYQSSFIPVRNAIDTFLTNTPDTFPIYQICDKSLFAKYDMWGDMGLYDPSVGTQKLWDGSVGPQGWPNIFHSSGGAVPGTFSFDMGKVYDRLMQVEETGRDCCHNPVEFEIWGIANITDAIPQASPNQASWAAEMTGKGWTMLSKVTRNDNGVATKRFNLISSVPPVRYIRVRVLRVDNNSDNVNLSELTFRYKD